MRFLINLQIFYTIYAGVQSINNIFHIVKRVKNVCVFQYILNLIDNVERCLYALYSSLSTAENTLLNFVNQ